MKHVDTSIVQMCGIISSLDPLLSCKDLESLYIGSAGHISDLSPLSTCTSLKSLILEASIVTDLAPLSSMPLLEDLSITKIKGQPSVTDLSPLSLCKNLTKLNLCRNEELVDLIPLQLCPNLRHLDISFIKPIKDLFCFEEGFEKLAILNISHPPFSYLRILMLPVTDLSPLSRLGDLAMFVCMGLAGSASLLPLAQCRKLRVLLCSSSAHAYELKRERPDMIVEAMPEVWYT